MGKDKISANENIDAALRLDGDPANVRAFYEDWAANYDLDITLAEYSGPAIAARLLQRHQPDPAARLLDAGCGTGLVGSELHALGYRAIEGFDLSESMAERARASGAYRQVRGGIDMMQAADSYDADSWDAVLSVGVFTLGHVPPQALQVLLGMARPGGLLMVSTRTHYYDQTGFQQIVDQLVAQKRMTLAEAVMNAPYNNDGDGHYWVFRKSG